MLKVLSSSQTKELDQATIEREPIAPIDLMERACHAFVDWLTPRFPNHKTVGIICGPGNNGGDGLGVARRLKDLGYAVKVWIVRGGVKETDSFNVNLKRLSSNVVCHEIVAESDRGLFGDCDLLIDALFGSGLSRPAGGLFAQVISCINDTDAVRIAIDIPSGLFADAPSSGPVVMADHTITFQLPKLAFFFPENGRWVGRWHIVDIGLNKEFIQSSAVENYQVTEQSIRQIIKPRKQFAHKGDFGHGLLIAGSFGKIGAAVLGASAAIRSGIGLLTVHIPACGYQIIQTSVPEAMASIDTQQNIFSSPPPMGHFAALGIGPGLRTDSETVVALAKVLKQFKKPMVIDADALNMISANRELLELIPEGSILTPHPKEFERLAGTWANDFERLGLLRRFSKELKSIVVLKGAFTSIACPNGNIYFNATGNPGMAKGGSGDVLTGILTALMAQGYPSRDVALLGVYVHGLAGDIAAVELGLEGMTATDLVNRIPLCFKKLGRS